MSSQRWDPDQETGLHRDAARVLAASTAAVRSRRLAEVHDLGVLVEWATLHAADPTQGPLGRAARRVGNVLVRVGGEGTPELQDFCLGEIAVARGTGVTATRNALADALDLVHRLPLTWRVCSAGDAEVGIARRVATISRHLPADRVGVVDAAVARMITTHAGGRVLDVAAAKVIEADPALHHERVEAEQRRRYVAFTRTDETGLRTIIARVRAGDAVWVQATVERVCEVIAPSRPDLGADELRSEAFGWLARPAELLALLLEHTDAETGHSEAEPPEPPEPPEPSEPELAGPGEPAVLNRAIAFPRDLLDALRDHDLAALRPAATLYVHLSTSALRSARTTACGCACTGTRTHVASDHHGGVARVEDLGPFGLEQLPDLLARTRLRVTPVLDLSDRVRSTAYEHSEALKERVHLLTGGDYWPFATSTARRVDYDHPTPYDHDAVEPPDPPTQTGTHNSGPLGRRHHRWKTHAGFRARQCGENRYVWLTPHGLAFLTDHRGTHPLDPEQARAIYDAPAGVDVYPSDLRVQVDR